MTRLVWGQGPRLYDQGVDRGVLYLDGTGVPWNGLIQMEEKASGGIYTDHYFEGLRVHISHESSEFEGSLSAYTYPEEFNEYNGYGEENTYERFGFSFRTMDQDRYKLHIVYNVLVHDTSRTWVTDQDSEFPSTFKWDIFGEPIAIPGAEASARITLETIQDRSVMRAVEDILYGTETSEPRLPDPAEIIELYESAATFRVTYHGDGSYTVSGPDDMVRVLDDGRFEINAPSAYLLDDNVFVVRSS